MDELYDCYGLIGCAGQALMAGLTLAVVYKPSDNPKIAKANGDMNTLNM